MKYTQEVVFLEQQDFFLNLCTGRQPRYIQLDHLHVGSIRSHVYSYTMCLILLLSVGHLVRLWLGVSCVCMQVPENQNSAVFIYLVFKHGLCDTF